MNEEVEKLKADVEKYKAMANRTRSGVECIVAALEGAGIVNRDKVLKRTKLTDVENAYVYALGTMGGEYLTKVLFPTRHFKTVMDDFLADGFFGKSVYDKQMAKWEKQTFPDADAEDEEDDAPYDATPMEQKETDVKSATPLTLEQRKIVISYDTKDKTLTHEAKGDVRDTVFAIIDDIFKKSGRVPRTVTRKEDGVWQMVKTDKDIPSFGKWRIIFQNETY